MTETVYAARTSHAFVLTETVTVAELMYQGATQEDIRQQVLVEDLFQLRSYVSRERVLRTVLKRLQRVPEVYVQLIATGNLDTRRLSILFLILREHRLLRELIAEVLLDKIQGFEYLVTSADLRTFFEGKRDQNSTVAAWSESGVFCTTPQKGIVHLETVKSQLVDCATFTPSKYRYTLAFESL